MLLNVYPEGWWYKTTRNPTHWVGPFETKEQARKMAYMLEPERAKEVRVVNLTATEDLLEKL